MAAFRVAVFAAGLTISSPALSRTWHILNNGSGDALTVQAGIDSASVIDNPYFCDMTSGDFTVASNSGVITHSAGPLGAFSTPGCGPVAVQLSTWGALKARYH